MKIIKSRGYNKLAKKYPLDDPEGSPADEFWDWPEGCMKGKKRNLKGKGTLKDLLNRKPSENDPEKDAWDDMMLSRRPEIL